MCVQFLKMVSIARVSSVAIIFVVSCFCGLILPYILLRFLHKKYSYSSDIFNRSLSILNCFSGGVFFSTSILALLPEARAQVEKAKIMLNNIDNYPATELILGVGFLLILVIESVTISCHRKHSKMDNKSYSVSKKEFTNRDSPILHDTVTSVSITSRNIELNNVLQAKHKEKKVLNESLENDYGQEMTNLRNFIMLLAFSIHMVFDGLELGLLDKENKVWSVLLALSIHKILILFSMGVKLRESTTLVKFAISMLFLSAVSPLGIGIGILMKSQEESIAVLRTSAVLQSFAVGTFVYVTFFEILLREYISNEGNRILKTISTVFGFASFAIISYIMPG